jgi:hypothetical protein
MALSIERQTEAMDTKTEDVKRHETCLLSDVQLFKPQDMQLQYVI